MEAIKFKLKFKNIVRFTRVFVVIGFDIQRDSTVLHESNLFNQVVAHPTPPPAMCHHLLLNKTLNKNIYSKIFLIRRYKCVNNIS